MKVRVLAVGEIAQQSAAKRGGLLQSVVTAILLFRRAFPGIQTVMFPAHAIVYLFPLLLFAAPFSLGGEKPDKPVPSKGEPTSAERITKLADSIREALLSDRSAPPKTRVLQKEINKLVGAKWAEEVRKRGREFKSGETAKLSIVLNSAGMVVSLRLISKETNPVFAEICEKAVRDAQENFPSIPLDVLDPKTNTLEVPITFTVY